MQVISNSGPVVISDLRITDGKNMVIRGEKPTDLSLYFTDEELSRSRYLRVALDKKIIREVSEEMPQKLETVVDETSPKFPLAQTESVEEEVTGVDENGNVKFTQPETSVDASKEAFGDNPMTYEEFKTKHYTQQRALLKTKPFTQEFLETLIDDPDITPSVKKQAAELLEE